MIPTFASPGVITPGQFGPMSITPLSLDVLFGDHHVFYCDAFGNRNDDFNAGFGSFHDRIGGKRRGTKMMDTSAPVFSTVSFTVLNTGLPR